MYNTKPFLVFVLTILILLQSIESVHADEPNSAIPETEYYLESESSTQTDTRLSAEIQTETDPYTYVSPDVDINVDTSTEPDTDADTSAEPSTEAAADTETDIEPSTEMDSDVSVHSVTFSASGLEAPAAAGLSTGGTITALVNSGLLANMPTQTLYLNDSLDFLEQFTSMICPLSAYQTTDTGENTLVDLEVSWDFRAIDTTTAGSYLLTGTILAPEDCVFAESVLQQIQIPVEVRDTTTKITSFADWDKYYACTLIMIAGSTLEELSDLCQSYSTIECFSANGKHYIANIRWNASSVDLQTPGVYRITGTITAPNHCEFAETLSLPTPYLDITVQTENRPEINSFYYSQVLSALVFPWSTPPGSLNNLQIMLSENNGPWTNLAPTDVAWGQNDALIVMPAFCMTPGCSYRLQVFYDGGCTGIVSFDYADTFRQTGYITGDRDGGDNAPSLPPATIQPPPQLPDETTDSETQKNTESTEVAGETSHTTEASSDRDQTTESSGSSADSEQTTDSPDSSADSEQTTNSSGSSADTEQTTDSPGSSADTEHTTESSGSAVDTEHITESSSSSKDEIPKISHETSLPENFLERSDEDTDLFSGLRLRLSAQANGGQLRFTKHGILVVFPESFLQDYQIRDTDRFEFILRQPAQGLLTLEVKINDRPLTRLPWIQITVPDSSGLSGKTAAVLYCSETASYFISRVLPDTDSSVFLLNQTGQFSWQQLDHDAINNLTRNHLDAIHELALQSVRFLCCIGFNCGKF